MRVVLWGAGFYSTSHLRVLDSRRKKVKSKNFTSAVWIDLLRNRRSLLLNLCDAEKASVEGERGKENSQVIYP
uniref:Uncharacterized protein n=1 Tax=Anguilla anguilla TaxID=7936 RepID=A0A0E9PYL3_ANGAN